MTKKNSIKNDRLVFGLSFFLLTTLNTNIAAATEPQPSAKSIHPYSSESIFQAPLDWLADKSETQNKDIPQKLSQFSGKKVILSMAYTSCKSACPLLIKKMKKISDQLEKSKINIEYVVISFDAEHDSPEKLSHFRHHNDLNAKNWHFWVGSEKNTRTLANLLNVKYSKNPKTKEIMHDNKIFVFNEKGELLQTLEGLNGPIDIHFK